MLLDQLCCFVHVQVQAKLAMLVLADEGIRAREQRLELLGERIAAPSFVRGSFNCGFPPPRCATQPSVKPCLLIFKADNPYAQIPTIVPCSAAADGRLCHNQPTSSAPVVSSVCWKRFLAASDAEIGSNKPRNLAHL